MIDPGNLVKADDTVLTTIVSLDPIYAYFDVDERTQLRVPPHAASGQGEVVRGTPRARLARPGRRRGLSA